MLSKEPCKELLSLFSEHTSAWQFSQSAISRDLLAAFFGVFVLWFNFFYSSKLPRRPAEVFLSKLFFYDNEDKTD